MLKIYHFSAWPSVAHFQTYDTHDTNDYSLLNLQSCLTLGISWYALHLYTSNPCFLNIIPDLSCVFDWLFQKRSSGTNCSGGDHPGLICRMWSSCGDLSELIIAHSFAWAFSLYQYITEYGIIMSWRGIGHYLGVWHTPSTRTRRLHQRWFWGLIHAWSRLPFLPNYIQSRNRTAYSPLAHLKKEAY